MYIEPRKESTITTPFFSDLPKHEVPLWKKAVHGALSFCTMSISAIGMTVSHVGSSTGAILADRAIRTFSPFGVGCGAVWLGRTLFPHRAFWNWIRIESWRLGIPAYFVLTQFYLSIEGEEESAQQARMYCLDAIFFLSGIQTATLAIGFFESKDEKIPEWDQALMDGELVDEETPGLQESVRERRIQPLKEISQKWRYFWMFTRAGIGLTMFTLPNVLRDDSFSPVVSDTMQAWGGYVVSEIAFNQIWSAIKDKEIKEAQKYVQSVESHTFTPDLPRSIRIFRLVERIIAFTAIPFSILLFYRPFPEGTNYTARVIAAGAVHGVYDSIIYKAIFTTPRNQIGRLKRLNRLQSRASTAWKITRVLAELGGLTYFFYLNFPGKSTDIQIAVGSMTASLIAMYGITTIVDKTHRPFKESGIMNTIFYNTLVSPGIGGIDPIFFYIYTVNYPFDIGGSHIRNISTQKAILAGITWAVYGGRMGEDMAISEADDRFEWNPTMSRFLVFSNVIAIMESLRGIIR